MTAQPVDRAELLRRDQPPRREPMQRDAGMTLIELLVTISLSAVLGLVIVYAVQNNQQLHRTTISESTGLADAKTVVERVGRDIRSATAVGSAATATRLVLWTDANGDGTQQSAEVTTWELLAGPTATTHLLRQTQGGATTSDVITAVDSMTFCYVAVADTVCRVTPQAQGKTSLVRTTLAYQAASGDGSSSRTQTFTSQVRNVR